jgi:hypothetical protein
MAAWSNHDDRQWADVQSSRLAEERAAYTAPAEPFPEEVWAFFTDSDLQRLVLDAYKEMGRRKVAREGGQS